MVKRLLFATLGWMIACGAAHAVCVTPLVGNDANGINRQFLTVLDASNNCIGTTIIVDGAAGANKTAVKAASTAAIATDPALVVAVSPNNTVGVTQATAANLNATVVQSTAANLNATVVGTGTFVSQINGFTSWAGGTLGAMANYGTSPGAVLVPGVNAFVTNTNANGAATAANSSPVVIAVDQGASTTGNIVANNTTSVVVNAAATTLYSVQLGGIGSAPAYLKLYNATSATCGSGTPVKRLIIPAAATAANGAGSNVTFPLGLRFSTGLTYCVTTGIGDADTTAPAASTFLVNLDWR